MLIQKIILKTGKTISPKSHRFLLPDAMWARYVL